MRTLMVMMAIACSFTLRTFAGTYYTLGDSRRWNSGTLDFMAWSTTWPNCGGAPEDNSTFWIQGFAQYKELYFSEDLTVGAAFTIMTGQKTAASGDGNVFVLDTKDYDLLYPKATGTAFSSSKKPLQFCTYLSTTGQYAYFFDLERTSASTDGAWRFSNLRLMQSSASDFSTTLDFLSGSFNALDPMGTGTAENGYTLMQSGAVIPTVVTFGPGFSLRMGAISLSSSLGTMVFNGSNCYCDQNLSQTAGSLFMTNGASIVVNGTSLSVGSNAALYIAGESTCVTANTFSVSGKVEMDGGTLQVNKKLTGYSSSDFLQTGGRIVVPKDNFVDNGGTFVFAGGTIETSYAVTVQGETGLMAFSNGVQAAIANYSKGNFRAWGGKVRMVGEGTVVNIPGTVDATASDFEIGDGAKLKYGAIAASGTAKMRILDGAVVSGGNAAFEAETNVISGVGTRFTTSKTITVGARKLVVGDNAEVTAASVDFSGEAPELVLSGGVLETGSITADDAKSSMATVSGDGVLRANAETGDFFGNIAKVACGEKGLSFDTHGVDVGFNGDLTDAPGVNGCFRKIGSGVLTVTPRTDNWALSRLEVVEGEFVMASDAMLSTEVVVTEGAVFSTAGSAEALTLGGLALTNATLRLDPTDVITVDGPISLKGLTLEWTSVPSSVPTGFLVVNGILDDETQISIRRALCGTAIAEGCHQSITISHDEASGRTTVMAAIVEDQPIPEADNLTWTGTGAWSVGDNWSGHESPTEGSRAVFPDSDAGKTVSVANGDRAGALRFGGDGYCLAGEGPLAILGEQGAAAVEVTAGSQTIDVPLTTIASLDVDLNAGSVLAVKKGIDGTGLSKRGKGQLTLEAGNTSFSTGVVMHDGMTTIAADAAFGGAPAVLRGGTVEFVSPNGALEMSDPLSLNAPAADMAFIKAETDVTLHGFHAESGALMKRGVGKLEIVVRGGESVSLANSSASLQNAACPVSIPDDGSSLSPGQYPAFGVAEGELVLRGEGENAKATLPGSGPLIVGVPVADCRAQAVLTIDNLTLDASNGTFNPGHTLNSTVTNPVLRIVNGGWLTVNAMQPGYNTPYKKKYVTIAMTNGTLQCKGDSYLSRMWDWTYTADDLTYVIYRLKDSNLFFDKGQFRLSGGVRMEAVGTFLGKSNGTPASVITINGEDSRTSGELFLRDGSVFAVNSLGNGCEEKFGLTFAFDNAEWRWKVGGDADFTLNETAKPVFRYEMRGQGVILKPAVGRTFRTNVPFVGEGGMIVDGPGTVAFGAGAYAFTGACNLTNAAATADLTDAGQVDRACFAGSGTVKGGTITRATVISGFADDWSTGVLPVFADCGITKLVIDAGRTAENPLVLPETPTPIAVAKVSGMTSITGFRVINTGDKHVSGSFEVVNGTVYMTPGNGPGLLLIVR